MASNCATDRLSPVNFVSNKDNPEEDTPSQESELDIDQILTGTQLSEACKFLSKDGENATVTPIIVDFRRVLQIKTTAEIVPGVPNKELVHAVVGLYNTSLSEMTPDVLYASVCDKQARTILLLRDSKAAAEECNKKKAADTVDPEESPDTSEDTEIDEKKECDKDVYQAEEGTPGIYAGVFSDQDEPEDDDSDEDDDEPDFSLGVHAFLRNVKRRRKIIRTSEQPVASQHMGIEHRLIGAATFEKTYCKPGEKIVHLTLVAVRRRFRKWGMGKYLLSQVKDMSVVGQYDAVVVHADNLAVDFFQRYGFTVDVIINSRFSELAEQYTNCTLMCYLPPFTNIGVTGTAVPELDILLMDKEITKWREKSLEAFRSEHTCMSRMRHEIIHLRALVSTQQELISSLAIENEKVRQERFAVEKEFLVYKYNQAKSVFDPTTSDDDEISSEQLIKALEREIRPKSASRWSSRESRYNYQQNKQLSNSSEPYDHGKDTEEFYKVTQDFYDLMKQDASITSQYQVQMVTKATLPSSYLESYETCISRLNDPTLNTRLYYCGSLEKPHRVPEILRKGFTEIDLIHGEYGRGLYFSKYPSKAAHFSALGMLLVAEVGLGTTETIVKKDKTRQSPSEYFDAIITPGRLCSDDKDDQTLSQEYVVFSVHQACPLYLITYSPTESQATDPTPDK